MDYSTVNEVANRKKMKTDAEKLKQMITTETEKVIKIKVGQDTAYWELKEKCSTTERHHERLQQNMVEVQMQLETVSAQYQEELRRRPETLNKLASTREISDVLEENMSRLRASLQRSAADRTALAEAYKRASDLVAAAHADNEKKLAQAVNEGRAAQERVKMCAEHNAQLSECVERFRSGANKSMAEAERLREHRDSLAENLARRDAHLQEKEKAIQELREEMRRVAQEFAEKYECQRNAFTELEREAGAATALRSSLTAAEARAEAASRDVTRIASELAVATAARDDAAQRIATLEQQKQDLQSKIEEMNQGINYMAEKGKELESELSVKDQNLQTLQKAFADLQLEARANFQNLQTLQKDFADLQLEARAAIERVATINSERERERREFEEKLATTSTKFAAERESKQNEFEERIASATVKLNEDRERERCEFEKSLSERDRELCECKENFNTATAKLTEERECQKLEYEEKIASINAKLAEERERVRLEFEKRAEAAANERLAERERENLSYEERVATQAAKLEKEHQRKIHDLEIHLTALKCDINERDEAIATLKHDNDELTTARANAVADLAELKTELERDRKENKKRIVAAEREIVEKTKTINNLESDIASEKKKLTSANNNISKQKEEHDKERRDFDERIATLEKQLAERNADISEMTKQAEEDRTRSEAAMNALKNVLNKAVADAGSAWEEVRTLKESVRSKDDEAKQQMKLILNARAEKEQMQKAINEMQEKINSIQEIAINKKAKVSNPLSTPSVRHDFPEHDDNAMPAPFLTPTFQKQQQKTSKSHNGRDPYSVLFSDTDSLDDVLDVNRRFDALSRGMPVSPLKPLLKRRQAGPRNQVPATQLESNVQPNPPQAQERPPEPKRKFFKTSRLERKKK